MTERNPFRPNAQDLQRIEKEVGEIPDIQQKLVKNHPQLKVADRVAHQYQIAGSKVELQIASELPETLAGVGLFEPDSRHIGIGRVSTGLGCPHLETDPDFLGLMLAFQTGEGKRVDFLGINHPGAPTDTHTEFMALLDATAEAAGAEPPFGHGAGELDLFDLLASNLKLVRSLVHSLGLRKGGGIALHVLGQSLRTAKSSTACQAYWTGIIEIGGAAGKFTIVPPLDENKRRSLRPGERHLTEEWRTRQAKGPIVFNLHWLPFIDEELTSTTDLSEGWEERLQLVGNVTFPQSDGKSEQDRAWAALAAEMGANPGNWIGDRNDSIPEPGTEFTFARKIAYEKSQLGRDVLPTHAYADVFQSGEISATLMEELKQRRNRKQDLGHFDLAP